MAMLIILSLSSCVINYPKNIMDPPWIPAEPVMSESEVANLPDQDTIVPVYFSEEDVPVIDGDFSEWQGLDGPLTRLAVFGGSHVPEDAEAFFVLRTDGVNLFVYARVTDDLTHENFLPGSLAWRGDTVELFIGTNTSRHKKYLLGDNQLRLVPRSKDLPETDVVSNQRTIEASSVDSSKGEIFASWTSYNENGYEIESAIPLSLLMIDELKLNQKIRCDFQVNDADETERDRMIHWISNKDTPWFDPSVWGNGRVVSLPETRKETPDEL